MAEQQQSPGSAGLASPSGKSPTSLVRGRSGAAAAAACLTAVAAGALIVSQARAVQ